MSWQLSDEEAYNPLAANKKKVERLPAVGSAEHHPYETALDQLRSAATAQFSPAELDNPAPDIWAWVEKKARALVATLNDHSLSVCARPAFDRSDDEIVQALLNDLFGMGAIETLLRLPEVEDIAINGPQDIWYKARGGWVKSEISYPSADALFRVLNRAIVHTNRHVGPVTPIVDATLRRGHRINIVSAPVADPWPVASIRIHRDRSFTMEELVAGGGEERPPASNGRLPNYFAHDSGRGMFSALAATFLHMAVVAGFNILVIGATGVGKTTVLGALGRMIPADRRVIVIEDTRELKIRDGNGRAENCVYFTTRPASVEGLPAITQRDLVLAALRQRPDALTVGEARGGEVFDMLKALWTGHRNGLTSIHADSVEDVPNRIRMMLQEANFQTEVTEPTIALWIAKAFNLAITLRRTENGRRYVDEIAEFTGAVEGNVPVRTTLFRYDRQTRRLLCTGYRPDDKHMAMLEQAGYSYAAIVEAAREKGELE